MNRKWFRKLLLSYLPVFFVVTTILFVVFFQTLNEQNRKDAIKANEFLAQQVVHFTDNSLKSISYRVINEILTEPDVSAFFNHDKIDVYGNIKAIQVMEDLKFSYPIIDSIYFVRMKDGLVLGDGSAALNEFPDKPLIEQYAQKKAATKWTGKRAYKSYPDVAGVEVVTFVQPVPYYTDNTKGFFVVNVGLEKLTQSITQMYSTDTSYVRLLDGAGMNLLGGEADSAETKEVFSNYISPYTGWQVESGPIEKGFVRLTLGLYNVWIILAIAAVLFGVVWVIYVTKRNYKPIGQLVSLIKTSSLIQADAEDKEDKNELGFIHSALEHLMDETRKVKQQNAEHAILQKKHRFHEALDGNVPVTEQKWRSDLQQYKLDVEGMRAFVQVLEIDRYQAFIASNTGHDQSIFKFLLSSIVQETVSQHEASVWAEWTTDRQLTAIVWVPGGDRNMREIRGLIAGTIVNWVNHNLSFTVTIGQEGGADTLEEIRNVYEKACNLLQYKALLGTGRLIAPEDVVRPLERNLEYFNTIHAFAQALRSSDPNWNKHLDDLFRQIRASVCTRKEIDSLLQFLFQHVNRLFQELSKEYRNLWRDMENGLSELEKQWETVEELQEGCSRIYEQASAAMQTLRECSRSRSVVVEIRSFIEEHYANPDLSLEYLSEIFDLNAKNISKLFKDEFGENFVDFLIGLRMHNAKRKLLETASSLQEISLGVGYYNYNSFNRAFKNNVGVSPSDFRRQAVQAAQAQARTS
ncbi:AraC-like DNA-binding protein [Paenibacillus phyllosphaerae]|uniref:AraC-like DNA-binding protein n=1 Tax=Paenibacillus phyllosphaerae TaxID=274593 RepID=A0A7W5AWB5_9BACL|nr:AraC family transcriptional regulator [Paenibacillus phyllosphaerae]MBB3109674.1 AraC-like DNA-binding protein [Paenibacillus phyllosphaerae]